MFRRETDDDRTAEGQKPLGPPWTRVMGDEEITGIQLVNLSRGGEEDHGQIRGETGFQTLYREVARSSSL